MPPTSVLALCFAAIVVYAVFADDDDEVRSGSSVALAGSTIGDAAAESVSETIAAARAFAREALPPQVSLQLVPYLLGGLVCLFWFVMFGLLAPVGDAPTPSAEPTVGTKDDFSTNSPTIAAPKSPEERKATHAKRDANMKKEIKAGSLKGSPLKY